MIDLHTSWADRAFYLRGKANIIVRRLSPQAPAIAALNVALGLMTLAILSRSGK